MGWRNLPLFLKVGGSMTFYMNGNLWLVKFVNPMDKNLRRSDGEFALGMCDNNVKTIFIANNQDDYKTEHILCHEITHTICFEHNIELPIDTEEWLCNFMADHSRQIINIIDELLYFALQKVA